MLTTTDKTPFMQVKNERYKAIFALVLCAALWSIGGLLIKMVSLNPLAIAGMRSAIAALVMLAVIKKPKFTWSFAQIGGAVAYTGTVMMFVSANKMTTAANAILLQYTAPIFVALLSWWFLKERVSAKDWIAIIIVMGGMVLFFVDDLQTGSFLGNIIAILSGVSFAVQAIFMRMQKGGSPAESILLGNLLTALIGLPFMFQKIPTVSDITGLVLLGVFQLGLAYVLYSYAVKHVSALETILIPVVEPVLNPVWVFLFMGEAPGFWALIGGLIVLVSITGRCVLAELGRGKAKEQQSTSF